jgi:hypothetical protein
LSKLPRSNERIHVNPSKDDPESTDSADRRAKPSAADSTDYAEKGFLGTQSLRPQNKRESSCYRVR